MHLSGDLLILLAPALAYIGVSGTEIYGHDVDIS